MNTKQLTTAEIRAMSNETLEKEFIKMRKDLLDSGNQDNSIISQFLDPFLDEFEERKIEIPKLD